MGVKGLIDDWVIGGWVEKWTVTVSAFHGLTAWSYGVLDNMLWIKFFLA